MAGQTTAGTTTKPRKLNARNLQDLIPDAGLPGIERKDLPVSVALAMVDDARCLDVIECMAEHKGVVK